MEGIFLNLNAPFHTQVPQKHWLKKSQIEEVYMDFSFVFGLSKTICFEARA